MSRFYQSQYIKPQSSYVPLPIDAMAARLASMQQAQDVYRQNVELLDKPFSNLPNDLELAVQQKQAVQDKLEGLRNLDYNDPMARKDIFNSIRDVRDMYGPQGSIGLINAKTAAYQTEKERIDKMSEKDPVKAKYLRNELDRQAMTGEFSIQQDPSGKYINTSLTPLKDWQYKDPNTTISTYLKDVMMESGALPVTWQGTPADAVSMYKSGTLDVRTKAKIDQALLGRVTGDPDLIMSATALSSNNELGTDESQFAQFDEQGNFVGWNQGTLLGNVIQGAGSGYVESKRTQQLGTVTDQTAIDRAKKKIDDPLVTVGQEISASNYANTIDNSSKLGERKTVNAQGQKAEWVKMMKSSPQLWSKYGVKSDGSNIEMMAGIVQEKVGFGTWMNQHGTDFVTSTGQDQGATLNAMVVEQKKLDIVNNAAESYATKTTNVTPESLNAVVKQSSDTFVQRMSGEDLLAYKQAQDLILLDTPSSPVSPEEKAKAQNTLFAISNKYGFTETSKPSRDAIQETGSKIETLQSKHTAAKDQFLKDNANTVAKETYAENTMPVLVQDAFGNYIVDQDATYDVNKQVNGYFTNTNSMVGIVTMVPKDPEHPEAGYYTLGELQAEEAAKQKEATGSSAEVKVSQPWYSTLPNPDGSPKMVVNVGTRQVPINTNSIIVNTGSGSQPLGTLNNTPATRTNQFVTGIYSSGAGTSSAGGYPLDGVSNTKVFVAGKPENGSWVNSDDLKVVEYDAKGNPIHTLTGNDAFMYLNTLEQNKQLK